MFFLTFGLDFLFEEETKKKKKKQKNEIRSLVDKTSTLTTLKTTTEFTLNLLRIYFSILYLYFKLFIYGKLHEFISFILFRKFLLLFFCVMEENKLMSK